MWEIIAIMRDTGKRVLLTIADNPTERAMILREERKDKRNEKVEAVRVWN